METTAIVHKQFLVFFLNFEVKIDIERIGYLQITIFKNHFVFCTLVKRSSEAEILKLLLYFKSYAVLYKFNT